MFFNAKTHAVWMAALTYQISFLFLCCWLWRTHCLYCVLWKKCPWSICGNRNEFAFMFQDSLIRKLAFGCCFFYGEAVISVYYGQEGKKSSLYSHAVPLIIMYNTDAKTGDRTKCSELNEIAPLASISQHPHTLLLKRCDSCMQTWVGTL